MYRKEIPTFNQHPKDDPTNEFDPNQVSNHFCLDLDHLKSKAQNVIHRSTNVYDGNNVEIISCGSKFSPYKSQLEREINEELFKYENAAKRRRSLKQWNWNDVITISSSDKDDDDTHDLKDTANFGPCLKKEKYLPKLTMKLMDESNSDDDFNQDRNALNEDMDDPRSKGLLKILRVTLHKRNRVVSVARSI